MFSLWKYRHDNGNCMRNKPQHVMIEPPSHNQLLAGEKFTSDQQCQLVFGPYSKICTYMVSERKKFISFELLTSSVMVRFNNFLIL